MSDTMQLNIAWDENGTPFNHTWEGLLNVDQFRWMIRRDMQDQLRMTHREINARHVRAVGIFDDEMRSYTVDTTQWKSKTREPRTNWQIVDYVIDSLMDIGINPMVTPSFTPSLIAQGDKTVFATKGRIGLPKDMSVWSAIVEDFTRHMLDRYGKHAVRQWYFEFWNEPNLGGFFDGTQADYFNMYKATWRAIKKADSELRVGGPATARGEWLKDFIEYSRVNDCPADFITTHVYNNDSESAPLSPFEGPQDDRVSKSPNFAVGVIRGGRALLDSLNYRGEIHWNEWGRSWWPCWDPRETPNEAAFIVRTMAEVSQLGDYFAYWAISDIYDQVGYGRSAFHGNYGMLSLQGLRKPSYHAHQLLARLGRRRLDCTVGSGATANAFSGAIATLEGRTASVLAYSYTHDENPAGGVAEVTVPLPAGAREAGITLCRVNAQENNILKNWRDMGSPQYLSREQTRALQAANELAFADSQVSIRATGPTGRAAVFAMPTPGIALLQFDMAQ